MSPNIAAQTASQTEKSLPGSNGSYLLQSASHDDSNRK
jgi:hypothetical protein